MLTRLWKKLRNLFVSEVRVQRPDIPMNRKQRRVNAALVRKRKRQ